MWAAAPPLRLVWLVLVGDESSEEDSVTVKFTFDGEECFQSFIFNIFRVIFVDSNAADLIYFPLAGKARTSNRTCKAPEISSMAF